MDASSKPLVAMKLTALNASEFNVFKERWAAAAGHVLPPGLTFPAVTSPMCVNPSTFMLVGMGGFPAYVPKEDLRVALRKRQQMKVPEAAAKTGSSSSPQQTGSVQINAGGPTSTTTSERAPAQTPNGKTAAKRTTSISADQFKAMNDSLAKADADRKAARAKLRTQARLLLSLRMLARARTLRLRRRHRTKSRQNHL